MSKIFSLKVSFFIQSFIILLLVTLCLTSCGFHPRGPVTLAPPLHNLYIKTRTPYSDLTQNLRRSLKVSNIHLAESAASSDTVLEILSENTGQQLAGVSSNLQTRQYTLTLTVNFQITDSTGKVLIPTLTATESRTLTISANQVLAGSNQADALNQDMRRAIVFDIMNILSSNSITNQLNTVKLDP